MSEIKKDLAKNLHLVNINDTMRKQLSYYLDDQFYRYLSHVSEQPKSMTQGVLEAQKFEFLALGANKEFIGYVLGYFPVSGHHLWIQQLAINKDYTRQGLGTWLYRRIVDHIKTTGQVDQAYLTCHTGNTLGLSFWKSLGFVTIGDVKESHVLMKASIRS